MTTIAAAANQSPFFLWCNQCQQNENEPDQSAEEEKEDQFVRIESWKGGLSQQLASCECAMT
jgi:hypothetical protein